MTKLNRLPAAGIDGTRVHARQNRLPDDMRDQQEHDLALLRFLILRREEVLDDRNLAESRRPGHVLEILFLDHAGQDGWLALTQLNRLLDDVLPDDRFAHV